MAKPGTNQWFVSGPSDKSAWSVGFGALLLRSNMFKSSSWLVKSGILLGLASTTTRVGQQWFVSRV